MSKRHLNNAMSKTCVLFCFNTIQCHVHVIIVNLKQEKRWIKRLWSGAKQLRSNDNSGIHYILLLFSRLMFNSTLPKHVTSQNTPMQRHLHKPINLWKFTNFSFLGEIHLHVEMTYTFPSVVPVYLSKPFIKSMQ